MANTLGAQPQGYQRSSMVGLHIRADSVDLGGEIVAEHMVKKGAADGKIGSPRRALPAMHTGPTAAVSARFSAGASPV